MDYDNELWIMNRREQNQCYPWLNMGMNTIRHDEVSDYTKNVAEDIVLHLGYSRYQVMHKTHD